MKALFAQKDRASEVQEENILTDSQIFMYTHVCISTSMRFISFIFALNL